MDSNIPSCGMGTTKYKVFRIARFCTNFLKIFLGEDPRPPTLPGISKGMFLGINSCTVKTLLRFVLLFILQN